MTATTDSSSHRNADHSGTDVRRMFDRIAHSYDILNHILSFGFDYAWRRKVAALLSPNNRLEILDLATGTGDLLISLLRRRPNIVRAVGLDISKNMLARCRRKTDRRKITDRIALIRADAANTPFEPNCFDAVTMAFGIRNTHDVRATLNEIHRILKPGGTALILEFSLPQNPLVRSCYLLYLRSFVPFIGHLISGDHYAYHYLDKTIENFYTADDFCSLMKETGFLNVTPRPLTFGVATIYQGYKSGAQTDPL